MRQVSVFDRFAAMTLDQCRSAARQQRIDAEGNIGRTHHLFDDEIHQRRQPLAAIFWVGRDRLPAGANKIVIGLFEAGRRAHHAVLIGTPFFVADAVER